MKYFGTWVVPWLILFLTGAVAISVSMQACAMGASGAQEGNKVVVLHKTDRDREIQVRAGDVIQIELEGIGGTGYWWYVTEIDKRLLELLSEDTRVPSEKKMGGPVTGVWRFKVAAAGKTRLVMKYYRVWEGPDKAGDQFSIILSIK